MSTPSDVDISGIERQGEGSSPTSSDKDSNNSRDVNLNSKKCADCNLIGTSENKPIKNGECGSVDILEDSDTKETIRKLEEDNLNKEVKRRESDTLNKTKTPSPVMGRNSTPKSDTNQCNESDNTFQVSGINDTESEKSDQSFLVPKSLINKNSSLSYEEVGKKFQDLSFAFKTDSMSIQKRLSLLKRRIDQAELNIENDLKNMKNKLESLKQFGLHTDYIDLISDLKKQLGFILTATVQLSSSAEAYGYAQHEEQSLEFVTIMVQHVENLESLKNEAAKMLDKFKAEGKSPQNTISFDGVRDDDRILRRRSVVALASEGPSRRRASIATLPRIGSCSLENVNGKGFGSPASSRPFGTPIKKSLGAASRTLSVILPGPEDPRRDSGGSRLRSECRTNESSMDNIEECPERRCSSIADSDTIEQAIDTDLNTDNVDSSLRQLYESIEEVRRNSSSQESLNVIYCLRRIIEWNKILLNVARFRWPEHVLHYVPFYITWYVVFILVLVFVGGLFTGINGCCTYLRLQHLALWFPVLTLSLLPRRLYQFILSFCIIVFFSLVMLFYFFVHVVFPGLSDHELDKLFKTYGFALKVRYPNGPSPV